MFRASIRAIGRGLPPLLLLLAHAAPAVGQCPCACPGDMTGNVVRDGSDIDGFVRCLFDGPAIGPGCRCADHNGDSQVDVLDVPLFVATLLSPGPCAPVPAPYEPGTLETPTAAPCREGGACEGRPDRGVANSIYFFNGEFHHSAVDLRIRGRGLDFIWARKYRSRHGPSTALGHGWDFSYNIYLEAAGPDRVLHDGNARADVYALQTNGKWGRDEYFRELQENPDSTYSLIFSDTGRWNFRSLSEPIAPGRIAAIVDRNGNTLSFAYDAQGRLSVITDTLGRDVVVGYDADGNIASVTDFTGRQVIYEYYQENDADGSTGDLKSARGPVVVGTPNGNDFPDGKRTVYTYSRGFADEHLNHNLLTITDPGGRTWLRNTYSESQEPVEWQFDRVVGQTWGEIDERIMIAYVPQSACGENNFAANKAIVNDRVGNVKEFFYDAANRLVMAREFTGRANPGAITTESENRPANRLRQSDPEHFETRWSYNADSMPTLVVHPNLNSTEKTYELDVNSSADRRSRGNLLAVTRQPGPLGGDQPSLTETFTYTAGFGGCGCGSGFVATHTDARGAVTSYTYDAAGNRTHTTHRPGGGEEDWTYNSAGQVTSHTLPANAGGHRRVDTYSYYASGPQTGYVQTEVIDSAGFALTTTYEYDAVGNMTRRVHPDGEDSLTTFNELDQPVRKLTREVTLGGVRFETQTWYDANDNIIRTDIDNRDETGALLPNTQFSTIYEYDILDHPVRVCHEVGDAALSNTQLTCADMPGGDSITVEYAYDANRNRALTRFGEATGGADAFNTLTMQYDERDRLFRTIRSADSPDHATDQSDYDGNGNMVAEHQGLEGVPRITTYAYDGYYRRTSMTDPMGNVTSMHYDANGNTTIQRQDGELLDVPGGAANARLSEVTYQYDAMDRRTRADAAHFVTPSQAPIGDGFSTMQWTYADNGQVTTLSTDLPGHVTIYAYDTANRRSRVTDAGGNTVDYVYDLDSNVSQIVEVDRSDLGNPEQTFTTAYTYDGLDRRTTVVDNVGNTHQFSYDSRGNRVVHTDARGNVTRYEYDGLNRLIRTVRDMDGDGPDDAQPGDGNPDIVTTQTWDRSSRLTSQTDDNGHTTTYQYDSLNRRITVDYADCTAETMTYDVHDNLVATIDANGSVTTRTYDLNNRMTGVTIVPGAGVSADTTNEVYQYDGLSRLIRAEDNDSLVTRGSATTSGYDSLGNVLSETQQRLNPDGPPRVIVSQFDGEGNRIQLDYPSGRVVQWVHDLLDRPTLVRQLAPFLTIATYQYIGPFRIERRDYTAGAAARRFEPQYDGIRRLIRTRHFRVADGATIDDRSYAHDPMHNKTQAVDLVADSVRTHSYDAASRLTYTVDAPSNVAPFSIQYGLDGVGNRQNVIGGLHPGAYTMDPTLCEPGDFQLNQYTTTPPSTADATGGTSEPAELLVEPFDYPDGNLVGNGTWTAHSGAGNVPVQVIGGQARLQQGGGSREDVNALLGATMGPGDKFYAAFDLINTGGNGTVYFAHFKDAGTTNFSARVFITNNGLGNFTIGLSGTSATVAATWPAGLTLGTTCRIVTSYEYATGNVELWVDPVDQNSPRITATGGANLAILSYALRQAAPSTGTSTQMIDNLCVSESFETARTCATPPAPPQPSHHLYDANGNLTDTFSSPRHYTYDYRNRLVQFSDDGTGQISTYRYDSLGRRIEKNVAGNVTRFYYDGGDLIEEQNAADATVATYVYSKAADGRVQMQRGGLDYYYHTDDLGSTRALTDNTGVVVERYDYEDYGAPTIVSSGAVTQPPGGPAGHFSDLDPVPAGQQVIADDFQFPLATNLTSLRWWGLYQDGPANDSFVVTIHSDSGGGGGTLFPEAPPDPVPGLAGGAVYVPTGDLGAQANPLPAAGQPVDGQWTLTIADWSAQDLGNLANWQISYFQSGLPMQSGGSGGAIPDGPSGCGNAPGAPLLSHIFLPPGATGPISVDLNITHTWVGDLRIELTGPNGFNTTLIDRPGGTTGTCGSGADLVVSQHPYRWSAPAGSSALFSETPSNPVPGQPGGAVYQPTGDLGQPANPLPTSGPLDGQWTLTITDWSAADLGNLASWQISYDLSGSTAQSSGPGGAIPDGPSGCGNAPGPALMSPIVLPPGATGPMTVDLYITHTYVGDLRIELTGPNGYATTLIDRPGGTIGTCGAGSDFVVSQHPYRWSNVVAGGSPDTQLYQTALGPATRSPWPGGGFQYDAPLNPPFAAQAGVRYWISIANNLPGQPAWQWRISTPANDASASGPGPSGPWTPTGDDMAFVLNPLPASGNPFTFHGHFLEAESSLYWCGGAFLSSDIGEYIHRSPAFDQDGDGFLKAPDANGDGFPDFTRYNEATIEKAFGMGFGTNYALAYMGNNPTSAMFAMGGGEEEIRRKIAEIEEMLRRLNDALSKEYRENVIRYLEEMRRQLQGRLAHLQNVLRAILAAAGAGAGAAGAGAGAAGGGGAATGAASTGAIVAAAKTAAIGAGVVIVGAGLGTGAGLLYEYIEARFITPDVCTPLGCDSNDRTTHEVSSWYLYNGGIKIENKANEYCKENTTCTGKCPDGSECKPFASVTSYEHSWYSWTAKFRCECGCK